ncbi:MAG TPA: tRNA lysidine(34) synthetase TilS [Gammaproteobacteria bacterium]|nr:tRNA lysidine(34) synthetase TilS [Gammaproteobacteria bacterium]
MSFSPDRLLETLRGLPAASCYRVGLSGGLDSTVLLQALAGLRSELSGELAALHVDHGLHPDASRWQQHCAGLCARLSVPLESHRVQVAPAAGESLEAVARERRYAVFRQAVHPGEMLLLAQHADDQLETFLLQALRGAGVRGLAAMPECVPFEKGWLARPLLRHGRTELEAWAGTQGLTWIEDPSNADTGLDRNYLRHEVLPLLKARWPAAADTVARAARHCAEAAETLKALAAEDWGHHGAGETLPVLALEVLPEARARHLMRHWIEARGLPLPPAHKLTEILLQARAAEDRNPCVDWAGAEVRRYGGHLYAQRPLPPAPGEFRLRPGAARELGEGLGALSLVPAMGEGIRAALCGSEGLRVAFRSGGESCRPAGHGHARPLKKWLQEMHVVPWLRDRLPLIYGESGADGELLAVAGLFACEPHAARPGEAGLRIEWRGHPPLA